MTLEQKIISRNDLYIIIECRKRVLNLLNSTNNINEDEIFNLVKPFNELLESNGININETNF